MYRSNTYQPLAVAIQYALVGIPMLMVTTLVSAASSDTSSTTLTNVVISSNQQQALINNTDNAINSQSIIGKEGLNKLGGPGQTNTWNALRLTPSVNLQNADPYGLSRPSSMRLRGKSSTHIGRTFEGLPVAGEPGFASGKGGADLFDMENMQQVVLMRGGVTADKGLGFSNSGVVDSILRRPESEFGLEGSQSLGAYDFRRSFVRIDSGELSVPARLYVSYSDTHSDKWRGPGETNRKNTEFGVAVNITNSVLLETFGSHHKIDWHNYKSLTYAQAQDKSLYKKLDYNATLSGIAKNDVNYYGYNYNDFTNDAFLAKLTVTLNEKSNVQFKPYYWKEVGYSLSGPGKVLGSPGITHWEIDHDTYGFDLRYNHEGEWGNLVTGFWHQSSDAPPPPTAQRVYRLGATGDFEFAQWSTLAKTTRHYYNNPYINVAFYVGPAEISAGMRYMHYKDPSFTYYKGNTAPDVSYDSVFDYNPVADPKKYSNGRTYRSFLPNLGLSLDLAKNTVIKASYGRTYGRQNWGSVSSSFNNNEAVFDNAGIKFDDVWNNLRPEISDNYELGARVEFSHGYIAPTLFHTAYKHKQLSLFDPALGIAYHQSVAEATSQGLELELGLAVADDLDVYASYSYNDAFYNDDAKTDSNAIVLVKDKQMQNSPRHSASSAVTWSLNDWSLMTVVRYTGSRYGDTQETEKVSGNTLVDLSAGYNFGKLVKLRNASISLNLSNAFDKHYIGIINTSDYAADGKPSYLPGSERTLSMNLSGKF